MKLKILKETKLKAGKPYAGKVCNYFYNERLYELILEIRIENEPERLFKKRIEIDLGLNSDFLSFCGSMAIYDYESDELDLDEFYNLPIICVLQENENGGIYVDFMDYYWECYTDEEDFQDFFQLTDVEMQEFFVGDIFNIYNKFIV